MCFIEWDESYSKRGAHLFSLIEFLLIIGDISEYFIQYNSKGPVITFFIIALIEEDLWGHVTIGSHMRGGGTVDEAGLS